VITRVQRFAITGEVSAPRPAAIGPAGSIAVAPPAPVVRAPEPIEQSG